ncbi:MAG: polysaccharide biosynthesis protein [Chitinophagales bacterium]|nr:MAG: polysaccharide biosynthesis protein [Chitinophagales bacterium]
MQIFLIPLYTHYLLPRQYGVVDLLTVVYTAINFVIGFELTQAVGRFLVDAGCQKEKKAIASSALFFVLVMYLMYAVGSFALAEQLTLIVLDDLLFLDIYRLFIIASVFQSLFYFTTNQLKWELKSGPAALVMSSQALLYAVLVVVGLIYFDGELKAVYTAVIISNGVGTALAFYFLRNSFAWQFDLALLRKMLLFSAPLVPSSLGVLTAIYIDRIMIKELLSLKEVGIYGIGYSIASVVGLVVAGVQYALMPLIYSNYKSENTKTDIVRIFRYYLLVVCMLILLCGVFSREIVVVFTAPEYYGAQFLIPVLMCSILFSNLYLFFPGLGIAKKTLIIALINVAVAFGNLLLNLLLIPRIGLMGAASATLLSALIGGGLYYIFSQRFYRLEFPWRRIFIAFLLMACVIVAALSSGMFLLYRIVAGIFGAGILVVLLAEMAEVRAVYALARNKFFSANRK